MAFLQYVSKKITSKTIHKTIESIVHTCIFFLWYALCLTVRWIGLFFSHYFGILTKIWRGRCFSHFFDCNGISIGFFDGMTVFWCYLTRYCFLLIDFIIYHLLIWFISSEAKRLILILVSFVFVIPILFFFWVSKAANGGVPWKRCSRALFSLEVWCVPWKILILVRWNFVSVPW